MEGTTTATREDLSEVAGATRREASSLAALLAEVSVGAWKTEACGSWSIDEVAGHVALVPGMMQGLFESALAGELVEEFAVDDPEFQAAQLDLIGEAPPEDRIEGIVAAYEGFAQFVEAVDPDRAGDEVWTPEGPMPLSIAVRIPLNELIVHRSDIVRAVGGVVGADNASAMTLAPYSVAVLASFLPSMACDDIVVRSMGRRWLLSFKGSRWSATALTGEQGRDDDRSGTVLRHIELSPAMLALLPWGRMTLEEASAGGAQVVGSGEGDADMVRLFGGIRPL